MPLVAGVDSSTSATKVEVRDLASGEVVGRGSSPHPPTSPPRSEQDPRAWWAAFEAAWAAAGSLAVDAIAVAGQQHGMVVLDAAGAIVRPAKLWNDTQSAAEAAALVAALPDGPAGWASACGSVPVASFTITKLAWLRRHEPASWARLAQVVLPHDWMTAQLTGGPVVTDRGDASGTGYWSAASGEYRCDLLGLVDPAVDWPSVVPPVLGPSAPAGSWRGAVVGPGTGDNMAGALGVGLRPGDVVVSIGTSGTVYAVSDTPTADPTGAVAGFADATGRHLPLVCTLNATKVTDAVRRLLGVDHTAFDALALAAAPGAGGLTLLPYLDGERTPDRPGATGVLAGLRSDVTREQLARAAVEGVVCGLLDALDALSAWAPTDGRLLLLGGGARSNAYRQILADLTAREVLVPSGTEHVATGAAIQAATVLTGEDPRSIAESWSLTTTTSTAPTPCPAADIRATYADLRDR